MHAALRRDAPLRRAFRLEATPDDHSAKENVMRFHLPLLALSGILLATATCHAANHVVIVGGGTLTDPDPRFAPSDLTIAVGDSVTFENHPAGLEHNVHSTTGTPFRCANGCDGDGGDGNPSATQWVSTVTFNEVGTVNYQCDPHALMGMKGVIRVTDGSGGGGGGGGGGGSGTTGVPITSGFTGAWYDPTQSGHGILVEVLPNNQFLMFWYAFNPDGTQQSWFGNVGAIDPATNTASVEALQAHGGRWIPNFDPANLTQPPWGTLTFSFSDCNHGRVDFASVMPGYGTGHMDLTRLTQPAGLTCQ
jgi:plastocyanin